MNGQTTQHVGAHAMPDILAQEFKMLGIQWITDDSERNAFLNRHFPAPLSIQRYLILVARRTIQGYRYSEWLRAYSRSGLPLLVPKVTSPQTVTTLNGGATATLSPVLAGIVTTGLAILGTVETLGDQLSDDDHDRLVEHYGNLMREGAMIAKTTGYQKAFLALTD